MSVLFFILVALATYHFVYEGILAPSVRVDLRFRLFALRDELRRLRTIGACDADVYETLQSRINTAIRLLPRITMELAFKAQRELDHNERIRRAIEAREQVIAKCRDADIRRIRQESARLTALAFLINGGGWFLWLLPLAVAFYSYDRLKSLAERLTAMPQNELERVFPGIASAA